MPKREAAVIEFFDGLMTREVRQAEAAAALAAAAFEAAARSR